MQIPFSVFPCNYQRNRPSSSNCKNIHETHQIGLLRVATEHNHITRVNVVMRRPEFANDVPSPHSILEAIPLLMSRKSSDITAHLSLSRPVPHVSVIFSTSDP
jgi:hypothetical protein